MEPLILALTIIGLLGLLGMFLLHDHIQLKEKLDRILELLEERSQV